MKSTARITIQFLCAQRDYNLQKREYEKAQRGYQDSLKIMLETGMELARLEERMNILEELQRRSQA